MYSIDWKFAAPLIITLLLAFTGYYYTYAKELSFANRKDQLERVDRQLRELYGPLYSLSTAGSRTWKVFRQVYRPNDMSFWDSEPAPTPEEAAAWRLWMTEVFMPLNLDMESLILKHSDLLIESEMPEILLELSAHIAGYKPILKSWAQEDYTQNTSAIDFPYGIDEYAQKNYQILKARQAELLGEFEHK